MTHRNVQHWFSATACVLAALMGSTAPAYAHAVTIPDDIPTLQAAMDSIFYSTIDTVFVRSGVTVDSLYAVNLPQLTVIGLGDSTVRPAIGPMTVNSSTLATFINLRFSGGIRTVGHAEIAFRDCRLDGGLVSYIDGDPRIVTLVDCHVTSGILAVSDVLVDIESCWFDGGSVTLLQDGELRVMNCTFSHVGSGTAVRAAGDIGVVFHGNRIEGHTIGVDALTSSGSVEVSGNTFDQCRVPILANGNGFVIDDNVIIHSISDGISCTNILYSEIARNIVGWSGGCGIQVQIDDPNNYGTLDIKNNTSFGNAGPGFELAVQPADNSSVSFTHNLSYGNHGFGLLSSGPIGPTTQSCNDWFANDSGAVAGIAPAPDDLTLDPRLCDPDSGDVHLKEGSPLLAAAGCGLIGALGLGCANTAVLVTLFTVDRTADGVRIVWRLADPGSFAQTWLERTVFGSASWTRLDIALARDGDTMVALDRSAVVDRSYAYRLVARDGDRTIVLGEPVVAAALAPLVFALTRISPNPCPGPLHIEFTLPRDAAVDIGLCDLAGRHIATLVHGIVPAGTHAIEWSGIDRHGPAPAGLYFVRFRYPGGVATGRLVRIR